MNEENRSYFRVDDQLRLSWHLVSDNDVQSDAELAEELRGINEQLSRLVAIAFQESPVIGEALGMINRKLDLLQGKTDPSGAPMKMTRVNLSGAGLGFAWGEPAPVGKAIDLTLVLKPSNVSVTLRAMVIGCEESNHDDESWWIRASYEEGQDIASEQVIQHVSFRQTELIQAQRRRQALNSALEDDDWEYED